MVIRVFLALLALCLSLPAMASPACAPQPSVGMHHPGQDHAPEKKAASHVCVGCVPVADWLRERVAEPVPVAGEVPDATPARLPLGEPTQPALRPPRNA